MDKIKRKLKHIKKLLNNNTKLKVRLLVGTSCLLLLVVGITTIFTTYSDLILEFNEDPDYVESSVKDNKVIINEVESDYYYYKSLNYTSNDGTIPTSENKNIYNDTNLVQTKITYKGNDDTNKGYVSLSERQDTYVYFKMYEVNNNGTTDTSDDYVLIPLIDNPFTDRPNNKGFNGWYTDYLNAKISYDSIYYERYVKVPVTYKEGKPEKIDITMTARWIEAKVSYIGSNFNNAIRGLDTIGMKKLNTIIITYKDVDMTGYYYQKVLNNGESYAGLYDNRGNYQNRGTCRTNWWSGTDTCTYYQRIDNENFDENNTYYYLRNGYMTELDNSTIEREVLSETVNPDFIDANMSTYYEQVVVNYGNSQEGYYDNNGNTLTGTCNSYNGCTNYKLLQYYKDNNEEETFDANKEYYYLVTRDTNILVLNNAITGAWSDNGDYPFTITSLYNGTRYNVTWNANSTINCYNDTTIENVTIYNTSRKTTEEPSATSGTLVGNYHNVKIGRGLTQNGTYLNLRSVIAGNSSNTGSNNNPTKYKFILESGIYNSVSLSTVSDGSSYNYGSTVYINNKSIYGNDYDKAKKDNSKLDIYFCASTSWSGYIHGSSNSSTASDIAVDLVTKSGTFGSAKNTNNGIYVGGRGWSAHYTAKKIKMEGGYVYNLVGGPSSDSSRSSVNDIYMYVTGGEVDLIIGGATINETYGNRIIALTGGKVNYSVFGGSNGATGTEGSGTLDGTTYIYIGGTSQIGDETLINNNSTISGAEAGSVFGNGNGRSGYTAIGSCNNSIVIIDDKATIKRNVYGGGNYGATGVSSSSNSSYTKIIINNGFIEGSVYGGGNKNGSGSSSKTANVNITMNGGNVVGSIYGGSNEQGTIFGTVNVNVFGGEVTNSVYGGGRGGYTNQNSTGTFVRDEVNVVIGDTNISSTPIINKGVYGGSAYGTVNGESSSTNISQYKTKVTVNKGIIANVFGGGEGNNTYTPYVLGDIEVTINNGTITNVFGGNDLKGKPNGNITVTINDGVITNTYGGGNETSANTTNVYLNGGKVNKIYGGSNISGTVTTSNVTTTGGTCETLYGGNNQGGTTGITNVLVNGGDITTVYGGGEATSVTDSTNVTINNKVSTVFGGSNVSGNIPQTNITVNDANINNIYGGNNEGGTVENTNININGTLIDNIYGGGLKAETTTTNINLNYGLITNVYGGGNEAGATTTNINLGGASIANVFGGSNTSGDVTSTNIKNLSATTTSDLSIKYTINKSNINQTGATGILGSETIKTEITNSTGVSLPTWDLYILTSKSVFDSNWSGANVEFDSSNNIYHIDEKNQWYGTNTLNSNSTYSFEFNIHSYDTFDNFKILGYLLVGYDNNGNKYISKLNIDKMYGGNNLGGTTTNANIDLTSGSINTIYGGGNKAKVETSTTKTNNVTINNAIYGGGNIAEVDNASLNITSSTIGNETNKGEVYGGGNAAKVTKKLELNIDSSTVYGNIYGGGNKGEVETTVNTTIANSHITDNVFGGGNEAAVLKTDTKIQNNTIIDKNLYGGGNAAEVKEDTTLTVTSSTIDSIFGGGNGEDSIVPGDETGELNPAKVLGNTNLIVEDNTKVKTIYGGGNLGKVDKNTNVKTNNITVDDSIYGGGNAAVVGKNTNIYVSNTKVTNSVYAGGNGVLAVVKGNTNLDIDNNSNIGKHVFGGGNAAATGVEESNNSKGIVNVVGAQVGGNIYGGANTSRLYGDTTVNIGLSASSNKDLIKSPITVGGTVFGGGEANASGSEEYDYSFISVTVGININIDGEGYDTFAIDGSIFGSGNASSTTGYSYVNIKNYGNNNDIKRNISIQRANIVTLDNSYIELKGATDRTNEYSTVLFSLSRIDELKLINSSSLYLQNGANLVKKLSSLALDNNKEVKAEVTLDTENKTMARNTNNRIYMLEGKNLNIATNENITSFGEVSGMTFFGMYLQSRSGDIITALYNDYDYSSEVSSGDIYYFTKGSYVLGMHKTNHDITKDGFYTNYGNEEGTGIIIDYIEPTPDNADFYMWSIGEKVDSYEITLTASKYSTLGTYELSLLNHASANTKFSILGFNYASLNEDIKLINYNDIPRIADTENEANTIFGLNMKSGQNGWITKGSTNFTTNNTGVNGTIDYQRENSSGAPGLVFYFYHSKNLTKTDNLGSVTISLVAITPIDDLNNEVKRININVNLNTALYNTNDYEGTITPGKKYEMFATSPVDITTKSSFSTYYSLYSESNTSPYKEGYHRSLVSTYLLPVNTEITMIDFHVEDKPVYYYYTVTEEDYNNGLLEYNNYGEVSYPLSKFVKMGSTSPNNNYDDESANKIYYKDNKAVEEFIFMVDFKDTTINEDVLDKSLLIELRNNDNQTLISVLGIEQSTMKYDLYHNKDAIIELAGDLSENTIYRGKSTNLTLDTNFIQDKIATDTIFDTNYDDQKLGIKMTILDSRGTPLTSSSLMGVNYTYNGNTYYPRYDGTVRINITEKVANSRSKITINTENSNLSSGEYTLLIESFGSADGIYYGLNSSDQLELKFTVIDNIYGLKVSATDKMIFINKDTGFTLNDNNSYVYKIEYTSGLSNPNIRLKLLRRDYSTIYTNTYNEVDLKDYVTNTLDTTNNEKEYLLTNSPTKESDYFLYFKDNLLDGTYKLVVSLYDNNTLIGEVYQYIIIK